MLNNLLVVSGNVATLFLMMAVGYFFARKGWLSGNTLSQLSRLLLNVVAPCIVISSLQVEFSLELLGVVGKSLLVLTASYVVYALITRLLFRRQPAATRSVLRFGTMFGNVGFMGLPLISAVLGQSAIIYCVMSLVVFNVGTWTYGASLMGERASVRQALLNPGVIGFAAAMVLFLGHISLPAPLLSAMDYLGDLNTPLAMVVIGGQMASVNLLDTFRERRLYWATFLKLAAMPLLTLALLLPLGLDPMLYLTMVILSGCPTAGATSMFSQMFHQDTATAAQLVTLSTLLSILTLPSVTLLAQAVLG